MNRWALRSPSVSMKYYDEPNVYLVLSGLTGTCYFVVEPLRTWYQAWNARFEFPKAMVALGLQVLNVQFFMICHFLVIKRIFK